MKRMLDRKALILTATLFPLFGWSCSTDFRDAVYGGVLDFVSGTVTDILNTLLPLAETIPGS